MIVTDETGSRIEIEVGGPFPLETSWLSSPIVSGPNIKIFRESSPYWTAEFLTARTAINALVFSRQFKRVYLPSYLCGSVALALKSAVNVEVKRYTCNPIHLADTNPSKFNGLLGRSSRLSRIEFPSIDNGAKVSNSLVVIPDYFGFEFPVETLSSVYDRIKDCGGTVLRDLTHSPLRIPEYCDYAVYSFRKFLGVPNGSLLVSYDYDTEPIRSVPPNGVFQSSLDQHLAAALSAALISEGKREAFLNSENMLNFLSNDPASMFFQPFAIGSAMRLIPVARLKEIEKTRRLNYSALRQRLSTIVLTASIGRDNKTVPFGFPVLVKNRDMVLEYLYKRKIYPIVHWRGMDDGTAMDRAMSCSIMTLPCDQRYTEDHMKVLASHVMNAVRECGGE